MIRPLLVLSIFVLTSCTQSHTGQIEIQTTSCATCHTPEYEATSTPVHVTSGFPMSCADCHRTTDWQPALEGLHPPEPKFPISSGPHGGIPCLECHDLDITAPSAAGANTNCVSCHPDSSDQRGSHVGALGPQGQTYAYTPEVPNFCLVCHPLGRAAKHPDNKFPRSGPHKSSCVSCHDRSAGPDTDGQNTTCLNSGCHSLSQEDRRHDGNRYSTQRGDGSNRHFCLACHPSGRGD